MGQPTGLLFDQFAVVDVDAAAIPLDDFARFVPDGNRPHCVPAVAAVGVAADAKFDFVEALCACGLRPGRETPVHIIRVKGAHPGLPGQFVLAHARIVCKGFVRVIHCAVGFSRPDDQGHGIGQLAKTGLALLNLFLCFLAGRDVLKCAVNLHNSAVFVLHCFPDGTHPNPPPFASNDLQLLGEGFACVDALINGLTDQLPMFRRIEIDGFVNGRGIIRGNFVDGAHPIRPGNFECGQLDFPAAQPAYLGRHPQQGFALFQPFLCRVLLGIILHHRQDVEGVGIVVPHQRDTDPHPNHPSILANQPLLHHKTFQLACQQTFVLGSVDSPVIRVGQGEKVNFVQFVCPVAQETAIGLIGL